jgi:two-component system phosphate regulon sensor histidine kinase PhoR
VTLTLEGGHARLRGIQQYLYSIVYNLCDNAIKYSGDGGRVTVRTEELPEHVRLTVSDNGIGIPPEHQDRVFERFYRVDKSRSKEVGGTGLGLSIVKHAARLHGAEIGLQSVPNEGSTFTITFPKNASPA